MAFATAPVEIDSPECDWQLVVDRGPLSSIDEVSQRDSVSTWLPQAARLYYAKAAACADTRIRARARAIGFVYSWSRIAAAFAGLAIGYFLSAGGASAAAMFVAIAMVVGIVVIGIFLPKTKVISLETINR